MKVENAKEAIRDALLGEDKHFRSGASMKHVQEKIENNLDREELYNGADWTMRMLGLVIVLVLTFLAGVATECYRASGEPPQNVTIFGFPILQHAPELEWQITNMTETITNETNENTFSTVVSVKEYDKPCLDAFGSYKDRKALLNNLAERIEWNKHYMQFKVKEINSAVLSVERTTYDNENDLLISECDYNVEGTYIETYTVARETITQVTAYCEGDPETCNERYNIYEISKNNIICDAPKNVPLLDCTWQHPNGFECAEWQQEDCPIKGTQIYALQSLPDGETIEFEDYETDEPPSVEFYTGCVYTILVGTSKDTHRTGVYSFRIDNPCIRSVLIFNGTCQDAINIYGGVCA